MNILFVHQIADRSEAGLLKWMSSIGDKVTVICDPEEPRQEEFESAGAHVCLKRVGNRLEFSPAFQLSENCREKPIDVLYSSFNAGISTSLMATLGLPTKVIAYRGTLGNLSRWDPSSYLTHLHPALSGIICNCPPIKDFLRTLRIPGNTIGVVYKGHSKDWYLNDHLPRKKDLGVPEDKLLIGLVANIRPLKGVEVLLEALTPLFKTHPCHLVLVGSDKDNVITQKVKELSLSEHVTMLGFRKDAGQLAATFDIACLPSTRREGVPRSIVEAMAHGKPCVVTDVGGLPHIVNHGENGLEPPNDPAALRTALEELLNDEKKRLTYGQASKEHFQTKFSLDQYFEKMREFFEVSQQF